MWKVCAAMILLPVAQVTAQLILFELLHVFAPWCVWLNILLSVAVGASFVRYLRLSRSTRIAIGLIYVPFAFVTLTLFLFIFVGVAFGHWL